MNITERWNNKKEEEGNKEIGEETANGQAAPHNFESLFAYFFNKKEKRKETKVLSKKWLVACVLSCDVKELSVENEIERALRFIFEKKFPKKIAVPSSWKMASDMNS